MEKCKLKQIINLHSSPKKTLTIKDQKKKNKKKPKISNFKIQNARNLKNNKLNLKMSHKETSHNKDKKRKEKA